MSKINVNQIKDILRNKIERTLTHSQWVVTDTNTFVESEVKDKIEEINGEERILRTQLEQNYDGVLEHIEKEIARIIKSKDLTIDSKSLEFKELRKQFLELRLIRSKWKKNKCNKRNRRRIRNAWYGITSNCYNNARYFSFMCHYRTPISTH